MSRYEAFDEAIDALPWGPAESSLDEPTNAERAARAFRALTFYEHMAWFNPEADTHDVALVDLLSDIGHLCRRQDIDFTDLFVRAHTAHCYEQDECDDGDMAPAEDGWEPQT